MKSFTEYLIEEAKKPKKRNFFRDLGGTMILGAALAKGAQNIQSAKPNPHKELSMYVRQFTTTDGNGKNIVNLDLMKPHEVDHLYFLINQAEEHSRKNAVEIKK